jgi:hypothetical protein
MANGVRLIFAKKYFFHEFCTYISRKLHNREDLSDRKRQKGGLTRCAIGFGARLPAFGSVLGYRAPDYSSFIRQKPAMSYEL